MKRKILIVDDEPNIVISLEFLMQQAGFDIAIARDGEQALTQMSAFNPDLVLLDVMLPLRDGFEVCQKIRENSAWNNVKVVMLSAKGREAEVSKGLALGADAYVTKPFSTRDLIARVRCLLADPPC
jgi:two-component system alkaline phosphatase synthesis response regulator PhoP